MKIHEFYNFINKDSELCKILKHLPSIDETGPWVAGGSVWKSIEKLPLNCDIDFFFQTPQQCEWWYRKLLSIPYAYRIVSEPKANKYNTSLQFHVHEGGFNKTVTIQLIAFKFFDNMEELLNGFDFTVCQFGYDGKKLYTGDTSFDDLRNREIVFNNIRDTVATAIHLKKYINKGFKISNNDVHQRKFIEIMKSLEEHKKKNEPCVASDGPCDPTPILATAYSDEDEYPRSESQTTNILSNINTDLNRVLNPQPIDRPSRVYATINPVSVQSTVDWTGNNVGTLPATLSTIPIQQTIYSPIFTTDNLTSIEPSISYVGIDG